ncbi:hypothetical protein ACJX0J_013326, partial [Zea mays]
MGVIYFHVLILDTLLASLGGLTISHAYDYYFLVYHHSDDTCVSPITFYNMGPLAMHVFEICDIFLPIDNYYNMRTLPTHATNRHIGYRMGGLYIATSPKYPVEGS